VKKRGKKKRKFGFPPFGIFNLCLFFLLFFFFLKKKFWQISLDSEGGGGGFCGGGGGGGKKKKKKPKKQTQKGTFKNNKTNKTLGFVFLYGKKNNYTRGGKGKPRFFSRSRERRGSLGGGFLRGKIKGGGTAFYIKKNPVWVGFKIWLQIGGGRGGPRGLVLICPRAPGGGEKKGGGGEKVSGGRKGGNFWGPIGEVLFSKKNSGWPGKIANFWWRKRKKKTANKRERLWEIQVFSQGLFFYFGGGGVFFFVFFGKRISLPGGEILLNNFFPP